MNTKFNRTYDLSPVLIWILLFIPWILGFIYIGFPDNVTLLQATNIEPIGFLSGLFHGFIIIISFIGSLFLMILQFMLSIIMVDGIILDILLVFI